MTFVTVIKSLKKFETFVVKFYYFISCIIICYEILTLCS